MDTTQSSEAERQPPDPDRGHVSREWGVTGIVLFGLSLALYFGRPIFIPAVIALLLACLFWPVVGWVSRSGIPWALSCTLVVSLVAFILFGFGYALAVTVPRFIQAVPHKEQEVQNAYTQFRERVGRLSPLLLHGSFLPPLAKDSALVKNIRDLFDTAHPRFFANTFLGLGTLLYLLLETTLVLFLLFFFLLEGHLLSRRLVEAITVDPPARARSTAALREMAGQVRGYLFWRTAINLLMALMFGLIFQFCGLAQPWTWALLTAILLYVPYLGTILAGIPPVLDAFITLDSPWVSLGILMYYVAFTTIEGYFIVPLVMGRSLELNASTILLTTLYWEVVWGPAGLFLSMPLMAIAKTVCAAVPGWQAWGRLLDVDDEAKDSVTKS